MPHLWEKNQWPNFRWDQGVLSTHRLHDRVPSEQDQIVLVDLPMKPLQQPCPVSHLNEKRNPGFPQCLLKAALLAKEEIENRDLPKTNVF